jgi:signal transduction histidine kinase
VFALAEHPFRTPLAVLQASLYILRKRLIGHSDSKVARHLQIQGDTLESLNHLIEEFLLFGRLEYLRPGLNMTSVCLRAFLEALRDQYNDIESGFRIELKPTRLMDCTLDLDIILMRAAIGGLLENALKFSPPKSQVILSLERAEDVVKVVIKDSGRGIPPSDHSNLFDPFYCASNALEASGPGLGLAIVKNVIELHGGSVCFESALDSGSTFVVALPCLPKRLN